jgi:hypothetical protein
MEVMKFYKLCDWYVKHIIINDNRYKWEVAGH